MAAKGSSYCGVKLHLQYPEFCELIKKNDIVCLQETKTDDIDKIDLEGYTFKMKNRFQYYRYIYLIYYFGYH
jgi:exonuclease III